MRQTLRSLAPTSFDDVAALVALYRPGPMAANMHRDYPELKNGRKELTYLHPDIEPILKDTYGLMLYQESVMRVAQKFAGYIARGGGQPAQGVREEDPGAHRRRAREVRRRVRHRGLRRGARHAALRHHRAVRRLRLQQVPLLRLRPGGLPDGLAEGALPGGVHGGPPHLGQGQQGQDGGLPRRVPLHGDRRAGARRQPLGGRVRAGPERRPGPGPAGHRLRAGGGAQRGREPGGAHRGRAQRQRALRRHLRLLPAGRPRRPQQADHGVAGQGRRLRLAGPSPPGPVPRPRGRRRPDARAAPRAATSASPRSSPPSRRSRPTPDGAGPRSPSPTPSSTRPSAWPSRRRCSAST